MKWRSPYCLYKLFVIVVLSNKILSFFFRHVVLKKLQGAGQLVVSSRFVLFKSYSNMKLCYYKAVGFSLTILAVAQYHKRLTYITCIIALVLCTLLGNAQYSGVGTWQVINIRGTLTQKTSYFIEPQVRSLQLYNNFHYHELKAGLVAKVHPNATVGLGVGQYTTYQEMGNFTKPAPSREIRVWPQLVLTQQLGRLRVEQRYRAELRFTNTGYRTRIRYRAGLSYALHRLQKNNLQLNLNSELFFGTKQPYFARNRNQLAITHTINKVHSWQVGLIQQTDYLTTDEVGRNFLQLGWFINLTHKKSNVVNTANEANTKDN